MASDYAMSTKARSLYSKHLNEFQYSSMLNMRDVPSIAAYLKAETRYSEVLQEIDEKDIHRELLEQKVRMMGHHELLCLVRYIKREHGSFYEFYTKKREIEQILYVLQSIDSHNSHYVNPYINDLNSVFSFDVNELVKQETYEDLYEFLKHTAYKDVLACLLEENVDISRCEAELDKYYQSFLKQTIQSEPNREALQNLFNMNDELQAFAYVYRLKYFYNAPAAAILPRIHYQSYHIPQRKMKRWIENLNAEELLSAFLETPYGKYIETLDKNNIEVSMDRIRYQMLRKTFRFATNTNLTLYAYMYLLRVEIQNIIEIIEGVRYNMSPDEIASQLIK